MELQLMYVPAYVSLILAFFGVIVMVFGAMKAIFLFLHQIIFGRTQIEIIRLEFGQHLALGLEFIVGKDIIDSIVAPTWDHLIQLAILIVLRTLLTYFLSREIEHLEHDERIHRIILKRRQPADI